MSAPRPFSAERPEDGASSDHQRLNRLLGLLQTFAREQSVDCARVTRITARVEQLVRSLMAEQDSAAGVETELRIPTYSAEQREAVHRIYPRPRRGDVLRLPLEMPGGTGVDPTALYNLATVLSVTARFDNGCARAAEVYLFDSVQERFLMDSSGRPEVVEIGLRGAWPVGHVDLLPPSDERP